MSGASAHGLGTGGADSQLLRDSRRERVRPRGTRLRPRAGEARGGSGHARPARAGTRAAPSRSAPSIPAPPSLSYEISIRRGFVGLKTDTRKYFSWKSQRSGCFTHLLSLIFILTTYENVCTSNVGAQNRCTFQNITDSVFTCYQEKMK